MGDFAKDKVNILIKFLEDKTIKKPNEAYRKTIDLIGEEVLKWKLQEMWINKFGREEEIFILRSRLNDLEANRI